MNLKHLKITSEDYINILKNRGITVPSNISIDKLLKKVKYLKRRDFRYIADTRGIPTTNNMSSDDLQTAIYTHFHKKKQDTISEILARSDLNKLAKRQNISTGEVDEVIRLNNMSLDNLKRIAKLRNVKNYGNLLKEDLVYLILRTEKSLYENNYLNYISNNTDDKIKGKKNIIRIELDKLGNIITKKYRESIKKYLYTVENMTNVTDTQKRYNTKSPH